jgi:Zn-dependent peptidase ImmA (M78 family)
MVPLVATTQSQTSVESTLRRVLNRDAELLRANHPTPVDLPGLLRELGIALVDETSAGGRTAHGSLRRVGDQWQIGINTTTHRARQRYTIAHELGHYMIEARMGFRPGSSREYWMVEEVCQNFAAALLSPREVVEKVITPAPVAPEGVLEACDRLIAATDLSLEAALRRVVDTMARPVAGGAIRLEAEAKSGRRPRASLLWIYTNRSWVRTARGQSIRKDHVLDEAAIVASQLTVGHHAGIELPQTTAATIERRSATLALFAGFLSGHE